MFSRVLILHLFCLTLATSSKTKATDEREVKRSDLNTEESNMNSKVFKDFKQIPQSRFFDLVDFTEKKIKPPKPIKKYVATSTAIKDGSLLPRSEPSSLHQMTQVPKPMNPNSGKIESFFYRGNSQDSTVYKDARNTHTPGGYHTSFFLDSKENDYSTHKRFPGHNLPNERNVGENAKPMMPATKTFSFADAHKLAERLKYGSEIDKRYGFIHGSSENFDATERQSKTELSPSHLNPRTGRMQLHTLSQNNKQLSKKFGSLPLSDIKRDIKIPQVKNGITDLEIFAIGTKRNAASLKLPSSGIEHTFSASKTPNMRSHYQKVGTLLKEDSAVNHKVYIGNSEKSPRYSSGSEAVTSGQADSVISEPNLDVANMKNKKFPIVSRSVSYSESYYGRRPKDGAASNGARPEGSETSNESSASRHNVMLNLHSDMSGKDKSVRSSERSYFRHIPQHRNYGQNHFNQPTSEYPHGGSHGNFNPSTLGHISGGSLNNPNLPTTASIHAGAPSPLMHNIPEFNSELRPSPHILYGHRNVPSHNHHHMFHHQGQEGNPHFMPFSHDGSPPTNMMHVPFSNQNLAAPPHIPFENGNLSPAPLSPVNPTSFENSNLPPSPHHGPHGNTYAPTTPHHEPHGNAYASPTSPHGPHGNGYAPPPTHHHQSPYGEPDYPGSPHSAGDDYNSAPVVINQDFFKKYGISDNAKVLVAEPVREGLFVADGLKDSNSGKGGTDPDSSDSSKEEYSSRKNFRPHNNQGLYHHTRTGEREIGYPVNEQVGVHKGHVTGGEPDSMHHYGNGDHSGMARQQIKKKSKTNQLFQNHGDGVSKIMYSVPKQRGSIFH